MMRRDFVLAVLAVFSLVAILGSAPVHATPYASNIAVSGTTVNFILNEPADVLTYSLNGGAATPLGDGLGKGAHTFTLGAPTDTFSIVAEKTATTGWTIPIATPAPLPTPNSSTSGMSRHSTLGGFNLISDDTSTFSKYVTPRGIGVNLNPNTPNFGTVYIANGGAGTSGTPPRTLGDGMYAIRADQTDAFGYGDTAKNPGSDYDGFPLFITASNNSPYHVTVSNSGEVYVADWADANSNADVMSADLSTGKNLFNGFVGTYVAPGSTDGTSLFNNAGAASNTTGFAQNHGSIVATYVTGSSATGDLVVYTMDEDLNSAHATGNVADPQNDRNSVWKYTIGTLPPTTPACDPYGAQNCGYNAMPTKVAGGLIGDVPAGGVVVDFDFSPDMSKVYMTQNRSAGLQAGLLVADAATGTILFNSLTASKALLNGTNVGAINAGDYNQDGEVDAADYVLWTKSVQPLKNEVNDATAANPVGCTVGCINFAGGIGNTNANDYTAWRARFGISNDILTNVTQMDVSPDGKWIAMILNGSDVAVVPLVNGIPDLANRLLIDSATPNVISARDITFDAAGNIHYVSSGQGLYRQLSPGGHTQTTLTWNGTAYSFTSTTIPGSGSVGGGSVPEPSSLVLVVFGSLFAAACRRRRA